MPSHPASPVSAAKRGIGRPVDRNLAERRRAELTRAAYDVFASKGYPAATIADITSAAMLSRATFYQHFTSKREILDSVFDFLVGNVLRELGGAFARPLGSIDDIEQALADTHDRALALSDEFPGVLSIFMHGGVLDAGMLQRIFFMTDLLEAALTEKISMLSASGLVAPGIDAGFLAHAVMGLLWAGLLKILRRTLTHDSRDEFVSSLSAFIRRFLVDDPARS